MVWTAITAGVASFAAAMNFGAAWVMRRRETAFSHAWSLLFLYTGAFGAFYAVMFALLLVHDYDRGNWSEAMTPFSVLVFLTIWTAPAVLATANAVTTRRVARAHYEATRE